MGTRLTYIVESETEDGTLIRQCETHDSHMPFHKLSERRLRQFEDHIANKSKIITFMQIIDFQRI